MQIQGGIEELIYFLVVWAFFVVLVESTVELILTAGPLEQLRAILSRMSGFFAQLLSCGYCTSVWVAFAFSWVLPSPLSIIDIGICGDFIDKYLWWFVNGLILHRLSNVFHDRVTKSLNVEIEE